MAEDANVKVFCRVRPPNERETDGLTNAATFAKKCITVPASDPLQQTLFLHSKHGTPKTFTFDRVFGEQSTQNDVFEHVGVPITRACLQGYNGTIFAYGQTGSGKTFTMQGPDAVIDSQAHNLTDRERNLRGLVPRVFDFLFDKCVDSVDSSDSNSMNVQHTFACSFLEIYNERVYDLLDGGSAKDATGLQLRENGRKGVFVEGLIESVVSDAKQAGELMTVGTQNRRVGQTAMNRESSRSHSVFILQIQSRETTAEGITKIRSSRFNLVDLAGSERQRNTEAAGERLKEAGSINKSLSALGNVIMGLVEQSAGKNRHVHYRDSKLTFLLKDSLGGNSKTFMIAAISPAEDSSYETLSTLKFAQRAKLIRNNAVINEDASGSVSMLQEEIQRLRRQLHQAQMESTRSLSDTRNLVQPTVTFSGVRIPGSPSMRVAMHCDPVVDSRFRELEEALAHSLEKNGTLKRSYEHLQLREERLKTLCSEMKKSIAYLKMMHRLRGVNKASSGDDGNISEYEPSVDAIEWRIKYEDMEENFAQLQDEVQRSRVLSGAVGSNSQIDGEIENLNMMLLTLTRQLAHIVRDKHVLQDKLHQQMLKNDKNNNEEIVESHSEHFTIQLREAVKQKEYEYESKSNTLLSIQANLEQQAADTSHELLQLKQREAAWNIQQKEMNLQLMETKNALHQAEQELLVTQRLLMEAKSQIADITVHNERAREELKLEFEMKLADSNTARQELTQKYDCMKNDMQRIVPAHDEFERMSKELAAQLKAKVAETFSLSAKYESQKCAYKNLIKSFDAYKDESTKECAKLTDKLEQKSKMLEAAQMTAVEVADQHAEEVANMKTNFVSELSELAQKLAECEKANADLQASLSQSVNQIASLQNETESLKSNFQSTEESLKRVEEQKVETESVLAKVQAKAHQLEERNQAVTLDLDNARDSLETANQQIKNLSNQITMLESDLDTLSRTKVKLLNDKSALDQKCDEMTVLNRQLEEDATRISLRHAETIKSLEQCARDERKELTAQFKRDLAEKQQELDNLRKEFDAAQRDNEAKTIETQRLHNEVLHALEAEHESVRNEFECFKMTTNESKKQQDVKFSEMTTSFETEIKQLNDSFELAKAELETAKGDMEKLLEDLRHAHREELERLNTATNAIKEQADQQLQVKDEMIRDIRGKLCDTQQELKCTVEALEQLRNEKLSRENEICKLNEHAEQLSTTVNELKQQLSKMDEQCQKLQKGNMQKDEAITLFTTQVNKLEEDIGNQKKIVETKAQTIAMLEEKTKELVDSTAKQIHVLESDISTKSELINDLTGNNRNLSNKIKLLKEEKRKEFDEKQQFIATCDSFEKKLKHVEDELRSASELVSQLKKENVELSSQLSSKIQEKETLLEEGKAAEASILSLKEEMSQLNVRLGNKESSIASLINEKNKLSESLASEMKQRDLVTEEKASLMAQLTKSIARCEQYQNELSSKTAELQSLSKRFDSEISDYEVREHELNNKLKALNGEIDAAKAEITRQCLKIEADKKSIEAMEINISRLESENCHLEKQFHDKQVDKSDLEAQFVAKQREWDRQSGVWSEKLAVLQDKLTQLQGDFDGKTSMLRDITAQKADLEHTLQDQQSLVVNLEKQLREKNAVVSDRENKVSSLQECIRKHEADWDAKRTDHEAEMEAIHLQLKDLEQLIEEKNAAQVELERNFQSEKRSLHRQLEESEQNSMQLQNVNQQLVYKAEQLGLALEEKQTKLKVSCETSDKLQHQLKQSIEVASKTKDEILAKDSRITELEAELTKLHAKLDAALHENLLLKDDKHTKAKIENMDEDLKNRSAEIERKEKRVEAELEKAEEHKNAFLTTQKELNAIKTEFAECRKRKEELELLKIQLAKEKQKLRKEVQTLTQRLDVVSKENDKLVGHQNNRQKIQHHIKVKEENNRLLGEVRQLTDEKFRLQCLVEKMERALKEKENIDTDSNVSPGSSVISSASQKMVNRQKLSAGVKTLRSPSPKPNKKRPRTQTEEAMAMSNVSLVDVAKSMGQSKAKDQTSAGTAIDNAQVTLMDVAKEQADMTQKKAVTLMDVAKAEQSKNILTTNTSASKSLQQLADEVNEADRARVEAALAVTAKEVKQEQESIHASVLAETVKEFQQEEQEAAQILQTNIEQSRKSNTQSKPKEIDLDEDEYSSFGDDDENEKTTKQHKKQKQKGRIPNEESDDGDNKSQTGGPFRTTISDSNESKLLLRAVYRGDKAKVREMLDSEDVDANVADQHGWSGLHWAASQGHSDILTLLLTKGAEVNAVDHMNGWSPLHVAFVRETVSCIKVLLNAGADQSIVDSYGDTVVDYLQAVRGKKKEKFLQLLQPFQTECP